VAESLGIDLGTTFTAAAVVRDGRAEVLPLGNRATAVPSLVFLREDESLLVGEAAERRGISEPQRLAREFKRRLGDTNPILLGPAPYSAERLSAQLLRWVLDSVAEREGSLPDAIALAHPANWGDYKVDLMRQAAELAGIPGAALVREPVAAAVYYASTEHIEVGETVAVYDLGGGTFDAAVVRRTEDGFDVLGRPEGIERLGGIDLDSAILEHVRNALGPRAAELDADDAATHALRARLREECNAAKEALSSEPDTSVHVPLVSGAVDLRLTRAEFESMIRPLVRETISALSRAIESAGLQPAQLRAVLLVGGSSRIPLVAEMVAQALERPVAVDAHPKLAVALGAALYAAQARQRGAIGPVEVLDATAEVAAAAVPVGAPDEAPAAAAAEPDRAGDVTTPRRRSRVPLVVGAIVALVVLGVGAFALLSGGDDNKGNASPPPTKCTTNSKHCVTIDDITEAGELYAVHYTASGFSAADSAHLRFFWDRYKDEARSSQQANPEQLHWFEIEDVKNGAHVLDEQSSFIGVDHPPRISGRGRSTEFCVGVVDVAGAFDQSSEQCAPLPA
jgi:actin-like ATPase involved in cell morphogenesis